MPRPCPHCLDSTGRVVEMVPDQPTPSDPRLAEDGLSPSHRGPLAQAGCVVIAQIATR